MIERINSVLDDLGVKPAAKSGTVTVVAPRKPGLPAHFFRHLFSGAIVFLLGVIADISITEYLVRPLRPSVPDLTKPALKVVYTDQTAGLAEVQHELRALPGISNAVAIGFVEDGTVRWKLWQTNKVTP